ncbi:MAG: hypothetical protein COZ32_06910 [Nitrospirae bacterium CG_4_10_14_3_um_filter_53_41]|nr:MAG: hypothetical protein COZ95_04420 [Nitrospirae bacterium CG_4_8_14_3_um_filter_50_41]PIX85745.1 MAG: hypothetical protein COZ32_06910 [Nitrospirae bacterium CG_4_10_14_3_um_filter_53_41]
MNKNNPFFKQAELMLRVIPHVAAERCFALKGGSAINLFVRNMPRLSVDMDLTYLPLEPRERTLENIEDALKRIAVAVRDSIPGSRVHETHTQGSQRTVKLIVRSQHVQIKIEPNQVVRGSVFPCEERDLSEKAEELFELSTSIQTLSMADLYGSKICAALDRQHPRDIFDIKILMENEGITEEIRKAFVVYLASHDRPMNELIEPTLKDMRQIFEKEFVGLTADPVQYHDLITARERFITILKKELTDNEKAFLFSVKQGQPEWELIGIEGIDKLPAIQWKLMNIQKMDRKKHAESLEKLRMGLGL